MIFDHNLAEMLLLVKYIVLVVCKSVLLEDMRPQDRVVLRVPQAGVARPRDHDTGHEHNSHDDVDLMLHLVKSFCARTKIPCGTQSKCPVGPNTSKSPLLPSRKRREFGKAKVSPFSVTRNFKP